MYRRNDVLKSNVAEIGAIGRNLNLIARAINQGERLSGPSTADLHALLRALNGLRVHIKALLNRDSSIQAGKSTLTRFASVPMRRALLRSS